MEIKIRPLVENDAHTSYLWRNIPEIWRLTGSRPDRKITVEDELAWINKAVVEEDSKRFAIIADDIYIGNTYLTGIDHDSAELHIFIGNKEYWGKGVASQAIRKLLAYAEEVLKIKTINLSVNKNHKAAIHLYKKLGFSPSGTVNDFIKMSLEIKKI